MRSRTVRVAIVDSETPSPFAASLLFSYVASFLYDGDAPLAERRAQALAVDQSQLRELIGDAELRELLDAESMDAVEQQLQRLDPRYRAKSADAIHDMLLSIGDLSRGRTARRGRSTRRSPASVDALIAARRVLAVRIAGEPRYIAVEDAARYRDALGVPLPPGIPESLLQPVRDPLGNLLLRYARTHAPFTASDVASRYGLAVPAVEAVLMRLTGGRPPARRRVQARGHASGSGPTPACCVMLRRRSLAKLRHEIEPVDQAVLGRLRDRLAGDHQAAARRRRAARRHRAAAGRAAAGVDSRDRDPAGPDRGYDPADLDAVAAAGEVVWVGVEPLGERDGRIALYLADHLPRLLPPRTTRSAGRRAHATARRARRPSGAARYLSADPASAGRELSDRESAILEYLKTHGASFFGPLHEAVAAAIPAETVDALWNLVWQGVSPTTRFTRCARSRARA